MIELIESRVVSVSGLSERVGRIVKNDNFVFLVDADPATVGVGGRQHRGNLHAAEAVVAALSELPVTAGISEAIDATQNRVANSDGSGYASWIGYSRERKQIWRVGELNWACQGIWHQQRRADLSAISELRRLIIATASAAGAELLELIEADPSAIYVDQLISRQRELINQTASGRFGWSAIDGNEQGTVRFEVVDLQRNGAGDRDRLELIFSNQGWLRGEARTLRAAEAELAARLERDPLLSEGEAELRATSADERSWLRISVAI